MVFQLWQCSFFEVYASVSPRCSICKSLPSASSLRNGPGGRHGTLWECLRCSVASQPCQEDTGHTSGRQRSQGHGTGTLAVCPAVGRPRIERLWQAAKRAGGEGGQCTKSFWVQRQAAVADSLMKVIFQCSTLASSLFFFSVLCFLFLFFYLFFSLNNLDCAPNQSFQ